MALQDQWYIEQLSKLEGRVENIEKLYHLQQMSSLQDKHELTSLITSAVRDGVAPLKQEVDDLKDRIVKMESQPMVDALTQKQRNAELRRDAFAKFIMESVKYLAPLIIYKIIEMLST